jgi:hypothetical protein
MSGVLMLVLFQYLLALGFALVVITLCFNVVLAIASATFILLERLGRLL